MPARPKGKVGPQRPAKAPTQTARPCPVCGKPAADASQPFCSPRCRDIDLNRWLSGTYVIPGRDEEDEGE